MPKAKVVRRNIFYALETEDSRLRALIESELDNIVYVLENEDLGQYKKCCCRY